MMTFELSMGLDPVGIVTLSAVAVTPKSRSHRRREEILQGASRYVVAVIGVCPLEQPDKQANEYVSRFPNRHC